MANEFKHKSVGAELTQAEFEATDGHVLDSQATGDSIYASSATQLTRLAIGATGATLSVASGIPAWAVLSVSQPTRAIGTVYQNTGNRPLMVMVSVTLTASTAGGVNLLIGSANPPTTCLGYLRHGTTIEELERKNATFIVPINYYYTLTATGTGCNVEFWTEWVL